MTILAESNISTLKSVSVKYICSLNVYCSQSVSGLETLLH